MRIWGIDRVRETRGELRITVMVPNDQRALIPDGEAANGGYLRGWRIISRQVGRDTERNGAAPHVSVSSASGTRCARNPTSASSTHVTLD